MSELMLFDHREVNPPPVDIPVEAWTVHLNVTVPLTTLMGLNQHPGELSGFGPITAEYARELAQHASWRQVLTDHAGQVL